MKLIRNTTRRPIKITLGNGVLHLGPLRTGQIADNALDRPSVRKLLDEGTIALAGEGEALGEPGHAESEHESTHGHPPPKVVRPKGNR